MVIFIVCSPCRTSDTQRRLAGIAEDSSGAQARCAGPGGDAQEGSSPLSSQTDDEEMGNTRRQAGAWGWCCISSAEQRLLLAFGNYLCPDLQNWHHAIARLFAHVIPVIVTPVVVLVQASNRLHIQAGTWHFLHGAPNSISSYTSLPEHPQQDLLSQCSPGQ